MPRNGSGQMAAPGSYPPAPGSRINLDDYKALVDDLTAELTDSLSRSGKGGMTGALRVKDGTLDLPGVAFGEEHGTGFYRAGPGDMRAVVEGALIAKLTAAGLDVSGELSGRATAAGTLTARALSDRFADTVNVKDYGAKGDGVTDDTVAIQAAIDAAIVAGRGVKRVRFPAGVYIVSAALTAREVAGLHVRGDGKRLTRIVPLAGLAGGSVFKWTNVRDSSISCLTIDGNVATPVGAGIEFRQEVPDPEVSTTNTVDSVLLNTTGANGMVDGIKMTCAVGQDIVNDGHTFRDVDAIGLSGAVVRIEHSNSLWHRIIGGYWKSPDIGVQALAGSFSIDGTNILAISREFEIGAGVGGAAYYPIFIKNVRSEVVLPNVSPNPTILYVDAATSFVNVKMENYSRRGSSTGATPIDFRSPGGLLAVSGSHFNLGQTGQTLSMPAGTDSVLQLMGNYLPFATIAWEGRLLKAGNWGGSAAAGQTLSGGVVSLDLDDGTGGSTGSSKTIAGTKDATATGPDVLVRSTVTRTGGPIFAVDNNTTRAFDVDQYSNVNLYGGGTLAQKGANASTTLQGNRGAADPGTDVTVRSAVTRSGGYIFAAKNNATIVGGIQWDGGVQPGQLNAGGVTNSGRIYSGTGVPSNTYGANGDFYFRTDTPGSVNQRLYVKSAGTWIAVV